MKLFLYAIVLLVSFFFIGCSKTELKGIVIDGTSKKPIMGVSVTLVGTGKISYSDTDGNYLITDFSKGEYTLRFTKEGYDDLDAPIQVISDEFFKPVELFRKLEESFVSNSIKNWIEKFNSQRTRNKIVSYYIQHKEVNNLNATFRLVAPNQSGGMFLPIFTFDNTESGWILSNVSGLLN